MCPQCKCTDALIAKCIADPNRAPGIPDCPLGTTTIATNPDTCCPRCIIRSTCSGDKTRTCDAATPPPKCLDGQTGLDINPQTCCHVCKRCTIDSTTACDAV